MFEKEAEEYAKKWARNEENEGKAEWACYYNGYLASAKPREKRIEELEKACDETQKLLDKQIEATYKLDKENAELKKDKKELCHSISEGGKACVYLNEQLTKAKEILKSLYFIIESRIDYKNNIEIADEMWRAEQFLNSEVEK